MDNSYAPVYPNSTGTTNRGLTKREHFAGLAMQTIIGLSGSRSNVKIAEHSVIIADALLAELDKGNRNG